MNGIIVKLENIISYNNIHIELICKYINDDYLKVMSEREKLYFSNIKPRYKRAQDVVDKDPNFPIKKFNNGIMSYINIKKDHPEVFCLFNFEEIEKYHHIMLPLAEEHGITISGLFHRLYLLDFINSQVNGKDLIYVMCGENLLLRDLFVKYCPPEYHYRLISSTEELSSGRYLHYMVEGQDELKLDHTDGYINNEIMINIWL